MTESVASDTLDPLPEWDHECQRSMIMGVLRWKAWGQMDSTERDAVLSGRPLHSRIFHNDGFVPAASNNEVVRLLAWMRMERGDNVTDHRSLYWVRYRDTAGVQWWGLVMATLRERSGKTEDCRLAMPLKIYRDTMVGTEPALTDSIVNIRLRLRGPVVRKGDTTSTFRWYIWWDGEPVKLFMQPPSNDDIRRFLNFLENPEAKPIIRYLDFERGGVAKVRASGMSVHGAVRINTWLTVIGEPPFLEFPSGP